MDEPLHLRRIEVEALSSTHLLRWHVEGDRPEVHLLVGVDARHDEEEAGALGAAGPQPPQPEHHGSLVLLHDLTGGEGISHLCVAAAGGFRRHYIFMWLPRCVTNTPETVYRVDICPFVPEKTYPISETTL